MSAETHIRQAAHLVIGAFVDELLYAGVRHFCVAPGSRSTPLAIMLARQPQARLWMHLDERSAAFFALGMAKALREPVALLCTSGTAAANFFPAVTEAAHSRVPLIVLTADRPHELRDIGAPQAIDQVRLYGTFVKWFQDLPEPESNPDIVRYTRAAAARAAAVARQAPAGPVHLNLPYREPLVPLAAEEAPTVVGGHVSVAEALRMPAPELIAELAQTVVQSPRGLIVCGPQDDPRLPAALTQLAQVTGYPLLADPLSGLRTGAGYTEMTISGYDAFLRDSSFAASQRPDLVLRFGAMPVSKPLLQYLQRHRGVPTIVVDEAGGWRDPALLATQMINAEGRLVAEALVNQCRALPEAATSSAWLTGWQAAERATHAAIARQLAATEEFFEGRVFAELTELLPDGTTLFAGNSMPIRDLDSFFSGSPRQIRLMGNRGVNGIDGIVSTALGAAAALAQPVVLVIGDISLYHDSNGLLAAKRYAPNATIVLLNNDGGGIFSFLAQAQEAPEEFEELFGTPHGLAFAPLAQVYGARYRCPASWEDFRAAIRESVAQPGLDLIEVRTNRARNVELHRQVWPAVAAALKET